MKSDENKKVEMIFGLREGILVEGLSLLYKSANVLAGATVHVERGMCSWSISSAYHAAFFAMKGIVHLLGAAFVKTDTTFIVDVWPPPEQLSSKGCGMTVRLRLRLRLPSLS